MYKLVVFATLLALATAAPGYIGAPYAPYAASYAAPAYAAPAYAAPAYAPWGHGIVSAPVVKAVSPAVSYANTVRIASPAVVAAHAPVVAAPAFAHAW